MKQIFKKFKADIRHSDWLNQIARKEPIYKKHDEIRSEFEHDYNRILHSLAYRRLKHKTQVFFATENDHICTRIEHVNHVNSISYTIAKNLGLNTELTSAIAIGHDLGHSPFGHTGEKILSEIVTRELKEHFRHERNSLYFIDNIETLPNPDREENNLNLTYAVRDGIICHCGEIDENFIRPRTEIIELESIEKPYDYLPYTWEGCVVKISDKIAYLGRDIEDAISLKILSPEQLEELRDTLQNSLKKQISLKSINNTILIHEFILDLIKNSNPRDGLALSSSHFELMNAIKCFNYENIYNNNRLIPYIEYTRLIICTIFNTLAGFSNTSDIETNLSSLHCSTLKAGFSEWLEKYSFQRDERFKNKRIYDISDVKQYKRAIIDYISGMTDRYAIKIFKEINSF
ncbi:MAG: HD domain-containing protein [Bacteroidia bacterium]|nr:HD domain-containing protein [Bacteroidia bacterium]